ncbi:MAG: serine hydrolase [Chloroflexota bacterium]
MPSSQVTITGGTNTPTTAVPTNQPTPTLIPTQQAAQTVIPATETAVLTPTATPIPPTATPIFSGAPSPACGQQLPILTTNETSPIESLVPNETAVNDLKAIAPENTHAALDYILAQPQNVSLVLYQLGNVENGVFLNPDVSMPLASVAKLITLAAYVEAVEAGQLNPDQQVSLSKLEQYYLPNSDLGTHQQAIRELEEEERVVNESVALNDVAWMMIRHSSNAASDYLHLLLGQERIEETAVSLDLTQQTAPCTFLSQFLAVSNHTRRGNAETAVRDYLNNPTLYGADAALLADAFSQNEQFRQAELQWRNGRRQPNGAAQRLFNNHLNPQGTAREYAALMGRFAQNGLGSGGSSFRARLLLEWPMQFGNNQLVFDNLGYKNGSLPGILTTAYYAYPKDSTVPVVITLFFRNLDNQTYRTWRFRTLPHDELARWLLANPQAISLLKAALNTK